MQQATKIEALQRVLDPEGIAIVGASETSFYGRVTVDNLRASGYAGRIVPINPRASVVQGLPCYASLDEAPDVDLVISAVARDYLLDVVAAAGRNGAAGVVAITAGLAETQDPQWMEVETKAIASADAAGMVLIGPNCLGLIGRREGAMGWAAPLPWKIDRGGTALIMQSGGMLAGSFSSVSAFGIGLAFGASIGNGAGVGVADWLELCAVTPGIEQIGMVLEFLPEWTSLADSARALRRRGTRLYALKSGRSEAGAKAAATHTGALAGSPAVASDLLRQLGIGECSSMGGLMMALALGDRFGPPKGRNLAVFTASGGAAAIVADACADRGVALEPFSEQTRQALVGKVGILDVANPLDVGGQALSKPEEFAEAVARVAADPAVGAVLYVPTLGLPDDRLPDHRRLLRHVVSAATTSGTAVVVTALTYSDSMSGVIAEHRDTRSLLFAPSIESALDGLAPWLDAAAVDSSSGAAEPAAASPDGHAAAAGHVVDEKAMKDTLNAHGIAVPEAIAYSPDTSPPLLPYRRGVLKGISPDVMHKSQHGLIALGITNTEELRRAQASITERARAAGVALRTMLLEEMLPPGRDLFLSVSEDPVGTLVALGSGGTDVEDRDDVEFLGWPATADELEAFVARAAGLVGGAIRDRLVDLIGMLVEIYESQDLALLECNPVRIHDGALTVLDALAVDHNPRR
jgi:acyl-CoA synthetase (NDP forming)